MGLIWSNQEGSENTAVIEEELQKAMENTAAAATVAVEVKTTPEKENFGEGELNDFYKRRKKEREEEMEQFRKELAIKKRMRQEAIGALGREVRALREERGKREAVERELEELKRKREMEEEGVEERAEGEEGSEAVVEGQEETEDLKERVKKTQELENQVRALKDVANIGKQILSIREKQVTELNAKLKVLEETGVEYEREVMNIKRLRELYDERERARVAEHRVELERERARLSVAETRLTLTRQEARHSSREVEELTEKNQYLTEKVATLDKSLEEARAEISELRIDLATRGDKLYEAESHLDLVNGLFGRVMGGQQREDIERVAKMLEENRELVVDLTAKGRIDQVASVLMDVAAGPQEGQSGGEAEGAVAEQQDGDIRENLTKVWRVLIELLSHHHVKSPGNDGVPESCYKDVETPRGPRKVISPSQTFIRLKDLILEKNCLVKEVGRLKMLNNHLETRLEEQENRLSLVTTELHKTWGVVNKLQTQHQQLHTQEKILRYELQHKRYMINEMKKELEICREQWEAARAKNSQTEEDWKLLREEFASRKRAGCGSTESGFEDEEAADSMGSEEHVSEEEELEHQVKEGETKVICDEGLRDSVGEDCQTETRLSNSLEGSKMSETPSSEKMLGHFEQEQEMPSELESVMVEHNSLKEIPYPQKDHVPSDSGGTTSGGKENERLHDQSDLNNDLLQEQNQNNDEPFLINWSEDDSSIITLDKVVIEDNATDDRVSEENNIKKEHISFQTDQHSEGEQLLDQPSEDNITPEASTSSGNSSPEKRKRTTEEILQAREVRLKRLEEQCKSLFTKMSNTSVRSYKIANKLDELHQQYGEGSSASNQMKTCSQDDSTSNTSQEVCDINSAQDPVECNEATDVKTNSTTNE